MTNEDLINIAKNIRKNAYTPLTGYCVGAALLAKSGTVYIGTNVDDITIPNLSSCAERVAIQNAMSHGERQFDSIAIVGGMSSNEEVDKTLVPCGVCLQYMLDQCNNIDIIVYINGKLQTKKISDFLTSPYTFNPEEKNNNI